jgi:hypothetical protein
MSAATAQWRQFENGDVETMSGRWVWCSAFQDEAKIPKGMRYAKRAAYHREHDQYGVVFWRRNEHQHHIAVPVAAAATEEEVRAAIESLGQDPALTPALLEMYATALADVRAWEKNGGTWITIWTTSTHGFDPTITNLRYYHMCSHAYRLEEEAA